MSKCLNCGNEITNPTRTDQKFCERPCFNEYRKKHAKTIKKKKSDELKNITLPLSPATLPEFEDLTISQIKQQYVFIQVKMLEMSTYKHKYLELIEKVKELIPREKEEQIIFINADGSRINGGRAVKMTDGFAKFVREVRKKEYPVEENITATHNEIELESAVNPILKD